MRGALLALALSAVCGAAAAQMPDIPLEALKAAGLEPESGVSGGRLQVMTGQRAVVALNAAGGPERVEVQTGRIGKAAPDGEETYKGARPETVAVALDASVERRQSILKLWNGLTRPLVYEAEITALRGGKRMKKMTTACMVPAGAVVYDAWPDPIVAVTLSSFAAPTAEQPACK